MDSPVLRIDAEYVLAPPIDGTLPEDRYDAPLTTLLKVSLRALVIPRPPRLLIRPCVEKCCELVFLDTSRLEVPMD